MTEVYGFAAVIVTIFVGMLFNNSKFDALEKRMDKMGTELTARMDSMRSELTARIDKVNVELTARMRRWVGKD